MAGDTIPKNAFERAMKALMDADPTQALFERTDRGSLRYNSVAVQVRAVLAAIREPSDGMLRPNSLFSHFYHDVDGLEDNAYFEPDEAKRCWQAMIDALLAEGQ